MVECHCLAAAVRVFVEMQRQSRHCLRQDADTGVHRRHLHGAPLGDGLAGGRAAEVEAVGAAAGAVLRFL